MAEDFFYRLRRNPLPPERLSQPVSEFTFVVAVRQIGMALQLQLNRSDGLSVCFQANGICFFALLDISDHIEALYNAVMRRPYRNLAYFRTS